jgi:hypothetical protein
LPVNCLFKIVLVIFPVPLELIVENICCRAFLCAVDPVTFLDAMAVTAASFGATDKFICILLLMVDVIFSSAPISSK